jgi:hypothetical protein
LGKLDVDILKLQTQFKELCEKYPGFDLLMNSQKIWIIEGTMHFVAEFEGKEIEDKYTLSFIIPDSYPKSPPAVRETGGRIPDDYHHYTNGALCLGAPVAVRLLFNKYPTLIGFVEKCLIPYLYRFSYKSMYGSPPYTELSHGWPGLLEYYQELFNVEDRKSVLKLLKILADNDYHAKTNCPCGSRKRFRDCHGDIIRKLSRLQSTEAFKREYTLLVQGMVDEDKFQY